MQVHYGTNHALKDVDVDILDKTVTAFIGPSGCGKSTFLRCLNRMNDTVASARVTGKIEMDGQDIYDPRVDPVQLRAKVGMVFQKPNPFPKSIYDNVAYGPKIHGLARGKAELDEIVETSLKKAALWNEVKDRLARPRHRPVRWPAAAPLHRPRGGHLAGSAADGRTLFRARPHRHRAGGGADRRTPQPVLGRDRDPLHAAGRPRVAAHGLLPSRLPCGIWRDGQDLHQPDDPRTESYITGRIG